MVVASRKLDNCVEVATAIERDTGRRALPVEFNVSHWDQCDRLVDTVYAEFGRCDVLVNNAGLSPLYENLPAVTEALYDKTHAVNAKGPFRLASLVGSRMFEGDGGSIINISSTGSWRPAPHDLPYAMAKAALNALTIGLAGAWNPTVRANTVLPGPFATDISKAWTDETVATRGDNESDGSHGRSQGHGGRVSAAGERCRRVRERRADPLRRRLLPHALTPEFDPELWCAGASRAPVRSCASSRPARSCTVPV